MAFAVRRRYGLPPTDERFLEMTVEDIVLDYWAHRLWDNPKEREEIVTPDFDAELAALEAASAGGGWETVADDRY